jgi:DNA-binding transcriptional LysR family regulator
METQVDTELLRTFLEVRKTRHFGRAAQNLFITQAAVSARVKQLEEALGVSLFVRSRNNIRLSGEGERLVPHAEAVLVALARARQEVALEDTGRQLHLGVRNGIWGDALQQRLYTLQNAEPELVVHLESHRPEELTRKLLDLTLDMAILYEPPSLPELRCLAIGELTLRLFSSGRRQTANSALAGHYVRLDWGGGFARFHAQHFDEQQVPALRTNMNEVALDYLATRGGSCFMPVSQKKSLAAAGLRPVRNAPAFTRQLNIAYHVGARQQALVERAIRCFAGVSL